MTALRVRLGRSAVETAPIVVGTWAWGDRRYWRYGEGYGPRDVVDAFAASADGGLDLFDTADTYGDGESEKIVGWLVRARGGSLQVATKYAPLPERGGPEALLHGLDRSLRRMKLESIALYQLHWCDTALAPVAAWANALADAVDRGLVRAVGVSNFSAREMRDAHATLARRGIPLASNQVEYSLLHRAPERDGVIDACRDLDVALLAFGPLAQGILTGRYAHGERPTDARASSPAFAAPALAGAIAVLDAMAVIAHARGALSVEQVAINWVRAKGCIPIVGAKRGEQAARNASALEWTLTDDEVAALDRASTDR